MIFRTILAGALACLVACQPDNTEPTRSVTISEGEALELVAGQGKTLQVAVVPESERAQLRFASNNTDVVAVDAHGTITTLANTRGTAQVRAYLADHIEVQDSIAVTVKEPDPGINTLSVSVDARALNGRPLTYGQSVTLAPRVTATGTLIPGDATISWSLVQGADIITLGTTTGIVEARGQNVGTVQVRVTATLGAYTSQDTLTFTVIPAISLTTTLEARSDPASIPVANSLRVGDIVTLTLNVAPASVLTGKTVSIPEAQSTQGAFSATLRDQTTTSFRMNITGSGTGILAVAFDGQNYRTPEFIAWPELTVVFDAGGLVPRVHNGKRQTVVNASYNMTARVSGNTGQTLAPQITWHIVNTSHNDLGSLLAEDPTCDSPISLCTSAATLTGGFDAGDYNIQVCFDVNLGTLCDEQVFTMPVSNVANNGQLQVRRPENTAGDLTVAVWQPSWTAEGPVMDKILERTMKANATSVCFANVPSRGDNADFLQITTVGGNPHRAIVVAPEPANPDGATCADARTDVTRITPSARTNIQASNLLRLWINVASPSGLHAWAARALVGDTILASITEPQLTQVFVDLKALLNSIEINLGVTTNTQKRAAMRTAMLNELFKYDLRAEQSTVFTDAQRTDALLRAMTDGMRSALGGGALSGALQNLPFTGEIAPDKALGRRSSAWVSVLGLRDDFELDLADMQNNIARLGSFANALDSKELFKYSVTDRILGTALSNALGTANAQFATCINNPAATAEQCNITTLQSTYRQGFSTWVVNFLADGNSADLAGNCTTSAANLTLLRGYLASYDGAGTAWLAARNVFSGEGGIGPNGLNTSMCWTSSERAALVWASEIENVLPLRYTARVDLGTRITPPAGLAATRADWLTGTPGAGIPRSLQAALAMHDDIIRAQMTALFGVFTSETATPALRQAMLQAYLEQIIDSAMKSTPTANIADVRALVHLLARPMFGVQGGVTLFNTP